MTNLFLRKTMIGGKPAPGDYVVLEEGRIIGRIMAGRGPGNEPRWNWHVNVQNPARTANGWENTLDGAKAAFKKSWERSAPKPPPPAPPTATRNIPLPK
jgi:hypothetical protein